jgi:AraC-like DNA-binding protein
MEVTDAPGLSQNCKSMQIVQKIHRIILGPFPAPATVSAVKSMTFADVSPSPFRNGHTARVRSTATTATTVEPPRILKTGSLHLNGISGPNPLSEIAQALAFARQGAEERAADEPLDREFPFQIKACAFADTDSGSLQDGQNRLALLTPLSGSLRVNIGKRPVDLCAGEILIAADLNRVFKAGLDQAHVQVLVISFLPRFVYSLGSPSHDYFFLLPFYANYGLKPPVVSEGPSLREIHGIIARLVQCYLDRTNYFEVGCKALFLELLYFIGRQFRDADWIRSQMIFQTTQAAKLAPVLEFVKANYAQLITLKDAASLAKTSVPQFVRLFKRVAGMSFVTYVTHIRLSRAARLLKESSLTIAQVAYEVGFSDQSYFDRRFKEAFGQTPREFRQLRARPGPKGKVSPSPFREAITFTN